MTSPAQRLDAAGGRDGIGGRLREARRAQRLSLAEVAAAAGLTKGFLSKIERDVATPSVASLLRLCHALHLSAGELLDRGDETYELPTDVEFVFVVAGELHLTIDDTSYRLGRGDALTFSPAARHSFVNPGADVETEVIWVLTPALPVTDDAGSAEIELR